MSNGTNEAAKQSVTDCNHLGDAAKLREACEAIMSEIGGYLTDGLEVIWCSISGKTVKKARAALSAPPRNCDRPECATTKAAQDVWRKEDGGKTAYYEWLLAPYHRPLEHGDERPGGRAIADDRARVRS